MIKGIKLRPVESGRIKIGGLGEKRKGKSGGEYRQPEKYDHFVITKSTRDSSENFEPDIALMSRLPPECYVNDKLVRLPILLWSRDLEQIFPTAYLHYTGKQKAVQCDGESFTQWEIKDGKKTGNVKEGGCERAINGTCCMETKGGVTCKPHGTLWCLLDGEMRIYRFDTTSIITVSQLLSSLSTLFIMPSSGPFTASWLTLRPIKVTPIDAKASTVYCCHVEPREASKATATLIALSSSEQKMIDTSHDDETLGEEFFPPDEEEQAPTPTAEVKQNSVKELVAKAANEEDVFAI